MIFPWDSIDSPSRSWSGSRKVAADRPWHHQDDRYGSGKIPRVSGRLHCELFGLKSLDARVFRLKGRKQKFSYFLVPRSESRGISRDVAMIHAGRNGSVPIMPCSWCTQQQLTGWVILSFFYQWTLTIISKRFCGTKICAPKPHGIWWDRSGPVKLNVVAARIESRFPIPNFGEYYII
jgi:hypothetical protein